MNIDKVFKVILAVFLKMSLLSAFLLIANCSKDIGTPHVETGSVTDIDNHVYKTVKIGKQWWMAENLKVQRYRNGDSIINIGDKLDSVIWSNTKTGIYFNGSLGILYNWFAIGDPRGIAPAGWHIPGDSEWKELEMYLGMSRDEADKVNWRGTDEGNKLKIQGDGSTVWTVPANRYEVWGSNESGFSAIAGGCVMFNGIEGNPGANYAGFWWTSTEQGSDAWYRYLDYDKAEVFRYFGPKTYGFSIRCIKDDSIVSK
jgi:uncharacterized protein (TIGR02145 family)